MILMIDNYDSFTYNLVQYFGELGAEITIVRNDALTMEDVKKMDVTALVISPGPGDPIADGGISEDCVRYFSGKVPVLGVCLGHQCIGAVNGGKVVRAGQLMHGKTSSITHNGQGIFKDIPSPFEVMRYHSLIVEIPQGNQTMEVTGVTNDEEIMAIKVKGQNTYGVQFHPESILTQYGKQILKNFLSLQGGVG
jgi:anthranilate synthase/aminodeoxychorismate synthase-like glutamine amidotransferase